MVQAFPGAIPVWAAIHTAFTETGAVDADGIRFKVRRYIDLGLTGVFCKGLSGEVRARTVAERWHVPETILDEARGRLKVSIAVTVNSIPRPWNSARMPSRSAPTAPSSCALTEAERGRLKADLARCGLLGGAS